jgi:hypothetical protein
MTRDHADLDAALSSLSSRRAPTGFAERLSARYAVAMAARRRRAALLLCGASLVALAVISLAGVALLHAFPVSIHGWVTGGVAVFATIASVTAHAAVHPLVHAFPEVAAGVIGLAAITAACCVALAEIIRRTPASSS